VGRLRNRRRGGGPARTIGGLTRTGTATKLIGSKGGVQNPIVGEATNGELVVVQHTTGSVITTTPIRARSTAALLAGADFENGGPYPADPNTAAAGEALFAKKGDNILTWTNGGDCTFTFWVF
jgi:hypothetical protein